MIIDEKYQLTKTDKVTKASPFGGNRTISMKPGQKKSCLLCLAWWTLGFYKECFVPKNQKCV